MWHNESKCKWKFIEIQKEKKKKLLKPLLGEAFLDPKRKKLEKEFKKNLAPF
jgi:hypothetical protein